MLIHQKSWVKQPFGERKGQKPSLKAAEERKIENRSFVCLFIYCGKRKLEMADLFYFTLLLLFILLLFSNFYYIVLIIHNL